MAQATPRASGPARVYVILQACLACSLAYFHFEGECHSAGLLVTVALQGLFFIVGLVSFWMLRGPHADPRWADRLPVLLGLLLASPSAYLCWLWASALLSI